MKWTWGAATRASQTVQKASFEARAAVMAVIASGVLGCGAEPRDSLEGEGSVGSVRQASIFGSDDRVGYTQAATIPAKLRPVGTMMHSNGGSWCTGTLISPSHVLTAAHCVNDFNNASAAAGNLRFRPHGRTDAAIVTRRIQGTGTGDAATFADFAILKLDRSYSDITPMLPATTLGMPLPKVVDDAGYSGDLSTDGKTLGLHNNCQMVSWRGGPLGYATDCDYWSGASGGPLFTATTTPSLIWGLNSLGGAEVGIPYSEATSNSTAAGAYFAFAPANAGGVGVSYFGDGRMAAYAVDRDFARISSRIAVPGSGWQPWYWTDNGFANGKDIAAARLEDGRQTLAVINTNGNLFQKWQQALDGAWVATAAMSPAPPVNAVRVAATGEPGTRTQLFIAGVDNRIYTTVKTRGANSPWSAWCDLSGTVAGLNALAVKRIGTSQFIVWSGNLGTRFRWANSAVGCTGWTPTETLSSSNYSALGLGVTANGRLHLMLGNASGRSFSHQYRDLSHDSWGGVSPFPLQGLMDLTPCAVDTEFPTCPPYYDGLRTFASGTRDGREVIVAVTSPNGEMFTTSELADGNFAGWTRFYK